MQVINLQESVSLEQRDVYYRCRAEDSCQRCFTNRYPCLVLRNGTRTTCFSCDGNPCVWPLYSSIPLSERRNSHPATSAAYVEEERAALESLQEEFEEDLEEWEEILDGGTGDQEDDADKEGSSRSWGRNLESDLLARLTSLIAAASMEDETQDEEGMTLRARLAELEETLKVDDKR